eukprot:NODE_20155_length_810_cov_5.734993.p5 GENE.NODE_20155_length_810_cov_5.734993~~NODE_20155_length_810_cov_5.734993.p5  ORF type:complete len:51 (-),score=23.42 NODE_20155_length_810_cov_5.734993:104-256(-)
MQHPLLYVSACVSRHAVSKADIRLDLNLCARQKKKKKKKKKKISESLKKI